MQEVNSFIKLLGKNYYSDFIIDINTEIIDFDKYAVLVKYQNTYYFELSNFEIINKWKETINRIKENYQEALTEIYTVLLSHDSSKVNAYLDFNTDAIKLHLNTLKKDFYVDEVQSRYYSIIDDNPKLLDLGNTYHSRLKNTEGILDEDVYKLFNNTNHENFESIYHLGYLYERNKALSFIPFSLFVIAQQFVLSLNKIRLRINEDSKGNNVKADVVTQSTEKDVVIIEETYFESFIKLLDNNLILKKSTAIGVMQYFKSYIKEIKSEILDVLQTKGDNRNDYLEFLINEVEKQDYIKNADISYIQKWLEEYKISIDDIFEMEYHNNPIEAIVARHYTDMDKRSFERDKAYLLQSDFRNYFCKHYADELIVLINSLKSNSSIIEAKPSEELLQLPKNQYLIAFINELNNERDVYDSTFIQCYKYGILNFTEYLKEEINENLLNLSTEKTKPYIDLVKNKLCNSHYYHTEENSLDKWISRFELQDLEFPFLENKNVNALITASINYHLWDGKHRELMEDIQLDFFYYASMKEAKNIILFIEGFEVYTQVKPKSKTQEFEIHSVFKSTEAFDTFDVLLDKFDISRNNINRRGVQAQLNAIWGCPKSRKEIFKEHAELKEYVNFLNQTFLTTYKSRTMSDGSKYHNSIKEWLN